MPADSFTGERHDSSHLTFTVEQEQADRPECPAEAQGHLGHPGPTSAETLDARPSAVQSCPRFEIESL